MINYKIVLEIISVVVVSIFGVFNRIVVINNGEISFNVGLDDWKILLVKSDFWMVVIWVVNNFNGGKDVINFLCDYLNFVVV